MKLSKTPHTKQPARAVKTAEGQSSAKQPAFLAKLMKSQSSRREGSYLSSHPLVTAFDRPTAEYRYS